MPIEDEQASAVHALMERLPAEWTADRMALAETLCLVLQLVGVAPASTQGAGLKARPRLVRKVAEPAEGTLGVLPKDWPSVWRELAEIFLSVIRDELQGIEEKQARGLAVLMLEEFVRYYGGTNVYITAGVKERAHLRVQQVSEQFTGNNHKELARRFRVSEQQIRNDLRTAEGLPRWGGGSRGGAKRQTQGQVFLAGQGLQRRGATDAPRADQDEEDWG